MHAATWQTWSRVKDPEGIVESEVYCLGVRADQVSDVVSWGPGRRLELQGMKPYRLPDGKTGKRPIFKAKVDKLIETPRVYVENKTSARLDRHNAGEYIDGIEKFDLDVLDFLVDKMPEAEIKLDIRKIRSNRLGEIDLDVIYRKKVDILPINIGRQNVQKLAIYNNPSNDIEEWMTCIMLFSWFFTRSDYVAYQVSNADGHGKFGYKKKELMHRLFEPALMYPHLRGRLTLGFYQIRLDDTVKWICFDVDDHKGIRTPEEVKGEVRRLVDVLKKYEIPFLLEASGSTNSYHIWILLEPTQTYNAYRFSRQIKSEADVECEVFPKQKHLTHRGKFGNLVKIPLGINQKNKVKSQFLDPSTFQPYSGEVPVPRYLRLREVSEDAYEIKVKSQKLRPRSNDQREPIQNPDFVGENLRYCMRGLLVDNVSLDGGEGHAMRVAISAEAYNTGLSVEDSVNLFKNQPDFDEAMTRGHVEYVYSQGYHRFSCRTLKDQCSVLVSPYCSKCSG